MAFLDAFDFMAVLERYELFTTLTKAMTVEK